MDIRDIQYFLTLAEIRNFTKTAEKFYITQSALSQKISRLEKEIGMTLFSRSNHTVSLTSAGLVFETHAKEVMSAWNHFHQSIEEYKSSRFSEPSVGIFMQAAFSRVSSWLTDFIIANPNYHINIATTNDLQLIDGLRKDQYTFIFLRCMQNDIPSDMDFLPLYQDDLGVLLHQDDPLANEDSIEWGDIVHYHLICEKAGITNTYTSLKTEFAPHGLSLPAPFAYTDNIHLLAELIFEPGYYAFTTHESGVLLQEKFPHIRYISLQPLQFSTSYLIYLKSNSALTKHPLYKYFIQRSRELAHATPATP